MYSIIQCLACCSVCGAVPLQIFVQEPPAALEDGQVLLFRGAEFRVVLGRAPGGALVIDPEAGEPDDYVVVSERFLPDSLSPGDYGREIYDREGAVFVRLEDDRPFHPSEAVVFLYPLQDAEIHPGLPLDVSYDPLVQQIVQQVSEETFCSIIGSLEAFQSRFWSSDSFPAARDWAIAEFESMGYEVEVQTFPVYSLGYSENLIVTVPGWLHPGQEWIIGAHLDSGSDPEGIYPGADDNASGSAAVLEAARTMQPYRFAYTVKFALWGAEEAGLVGSSYYVAEAAAAGDSIMGYINLDMILYGPVYGPIGCDIVEVVYDKESEPLSVLYDQITDIYVPELERTFTFASAGGSDFASFWNDGYTAIGLWETMLSSNPYYHQSDDLLENYLEYFPFGTDVTRSAVACIAALAQPIELGIGDEQPGVGVSASPSPARSVVHVTVTGPDVAGLDLFLFDLSGRLVASIPVGSGGYVDLDVSSMSNGVYFASVTGCSGIIGTCRLVVCR